MKNKFLLFGKENIFNYSFILLCITPYWLIENIKSLDKVVFSYFLAFFLIVVLIDSSIKKISNKKIKLKTKYFFYSVIFFYGFDSKIGFWSIFENLTKTSTINYLSSFLFATLIITLFYFLILKKEDEVKKLFFLIILFFFSVNIFLNFSVNQRFDKIENLEINKNTFSKKNKKTLILLLDELVGYDIIDENIKFGKLAKQSYLQLFSKYNFELYTSAYSIYQNSVDSIPHLLNYDFKTSSYKRKKYVKENIVDKNTKWTLSSNLFFENNKNKKIVSNKNRAFNFCEYFVSECIASNDINNYKKYINSFDFSSTEFFIKKMHSQKSILTQYVWRIIFSFNIINNYHYLTLNKVKFKNDLKNLEAYISNSNFDIYFFHFLFPHRPFVFDVDLKNQKCNFQKKYIANINFQKRIDILEQHYKEIICTNYYLNEFLENLFSNSNNSNLEVLIISDTGIKFPGEKTKHDNIDAFSVLFGIKSKDTKFVLNNNSISSQEIFFNFFNQSNNNQTKTLKSNKVYSEKQQSFIKLYNSKK
tara:strand:- start:1612 stop:3207 length:1596 start_codon:yes stop_codon:yes gene_type:complete